MSNLLQSCGTFYCALETASKFRNRTKPYWVAIFRRKSALDLFTELYTESLGVNILGIAFVLRRLYKILILNFVAFWM